MDSMRLVGSLDMSEQRRAHIWILAILLLVLGSLFLMRGPVRGLSSGQDLVHLYSATVLWIDGGNPYDGGQCVEAMREAGHQDPEHVSNGSFYPPPTIAVLSPLGLMGWDTARLIWLVINLGACAVMLWVLASWLEIQRTRERWALAALLIVAWGPVATTLSLGQLSMVSASLAFAGLLLLDRGKIWIAGLAIGISCLVKPQLGLGFWLLVLFRRDWHAAAVATLVMVLVSGIGVGRLMMTVPDWAGQLASNIQRDQAPGKVLDASLQGPLRYQMIDLRPLLHLVLPRGMVALSALFIVGSLAAIALTKLMRVGLRQSTLLAVAGVGLLTLMPAYHRYYDAVLLLPLLALCVNEWMKPHRDLRIFMISTAMLGLVLPLPAILAVMQQREVIPEVLGNTWAWQHLILQVQSWCLLIAAVTLVLWTYRTVKRTS